jgi:hypothetical protein
VPVEEPSTASITDISRHRKPLKPAGALDLQRVEFGKYLFAPNGLQW